MKARNSWPKVLGALAKPMHALQLAPIVCLHPRTVARLLKELHTENLIHISKWVHRSPTGPHVPVYSYGPGESVPHPTAYTPSEKTRRYRARLTRSERESFLQKRRIARPDIAASWITPKKDLQDSLG